MSFEINPVLAGKFDAPDYAPVNNLAQTTAGTDQVSDDRRYTKFDHSATEAGTATMSFSDVVDMLNPLEHIPVVSSVYRAITGEEINPVSRVAGDILYGGALGVASAVFSGVSAVADAGLEQQTGKDSGGLAMAALFGPDDDKTAKVQLADAGSSASPAAPASTSGSISKTQNIELAQSMTATPLLAALAIPGGASTAPASANNTSSSGTPASTLSPAQTEPATIGAPALAANTESNPAATPAALQNLEKAAVASALSAPSMAAAETATDNIGGIPLAKVSGNGKQAYGGVMGPADAKDMAMALAQGAPGIHMGNMIYANKFVNGTHNVPPRLSNGVGTRAPATVTAPAPVLPASSASAATNTAAAGVTTPNQGLFSSTADTSTASIATQNNALASQMMQGMMMKSLGQYGAMGSGSASAPGSMINLNY